MSYNRLYVEDKVPITVTTISSRNALDVNLVGGNVSIDNAEISVELDAIQGDSVRIYGNDSGTQREVSVDSSGNINTNIISIPSITIDSSVLPVNAAQESGGNLDILSSIDYALESTLDLVKTNTDHLDVNLSTLLKPSDTLSKVSVVDTISNTVNVAGPLTDTELRATPVQINGTITSNIGTTGGLALDSSLSTIHSDLTSVESILAEIALDTDSLDANLSTLATSANQVNTNTRLDTLHADNVASQGKLDTANANLETINTSIQASQPRKMQDGAGNSLTSSLVNTKQALDIHQVDTSFIISGLTAVGNPPSLNPVSIAGVDGGGLKRAIATEQTGELKSVLYAYGQDGDLEALDANEYGDLHVSIDPRTGAVDSFGRLRISNPVSQISSALINDKQLLFWDEALTGGGTSTYLTNEAAVQLSVGTASGDKVVRQTKKYAKYQPGKSLLILMSFLFGAGVTNLRRRVGYFDANNGIFLEQSGTTLSFVRRTNVTGTPVDNAVAQSSWNIDKFDGTGPSRITLDISKVQIFLADIEWLGVGSVRVGFVIDGHLYYAHTFNNANILTSVYMSSATLPCRYSIENLAAQGSSHTMKAICASVSSEGGFEDLGVIRSAISGTSPKAAPALPAAAIPLVSIRLRSDRINSQLIPLDVDLVVDTTDGIFYQVILNPTLTGASFADVDTSTSITQYDNSATAYSGGTIIQQGFIDSISRSGIDIFIPSNIAMGSKLDGTTDIFTVVANQIFGSGTANAYASIRFKEIV